MKRGMTRAAGGTITRVADMSLPPEQRRRRRTGKGSGRKGGGTAQLDHGNGSRAGRLRKRGEWVLRQARGRR